MERTAWTDERLSDLAQRMDAGFERVDADIRELRTETRAGFDEVHRRIDAQGGELRGEIDSLRQTILRVGGGMMVGLLGVIVAVVARGA